MGQEKSKKICCELKITYFKPQAVPLNELEEVDLTLDKLETWKFANLENLNQTEAAEQMVMYQSIF